jgi:hypothetical protein
VRARKAKRAEKNLRILYAILLGAVNVLFCRAGVNAGLVSVCL